MVVERTRIDAVCPVRSRERDGRKSRLRVVRYAICVLARRYQRLTHMKNWRRIDRCSIIYVCRINSRHGSITKRHLSDLECRASRVDKVPALCREGHRSRADILVVGVAQCIVDVLRQRIAPQPDDCFRIQLYVVTGVLLRWDVVDCYKGARRKIYRRDSERLSQRACIVALSCCYCLSRRTCIDIVLIRCVKAICIQDDCATIHRRLYLYRRLYRTASVLLTCYVPSRERVERTSVYGEVYYLAAREVTVRRRQYAYRRLPRISVV